MAPDLFQISEEGLIVIIICGLACLVFLSMHLILNKLLAPNRKED